MATYEQLQAYADELYAQLDLAQQKVRELGEGWQPLSSEWLALLDARAEVASLSCKVKLVEAAVSNQRKGFFSRLFSTQEGGE